MPSGDTPCNHDNQDGFRIAVSTLSKWGMQIHPGKFEVFLSLREINISRQKMAMPKSHWYFANSLPLTLFYQKILFHMHFAWPHNKFIIQLRSHLNLEFLTLCQGFCRCLLLSFQLCLRNLVLCVCVCVCVSWENPVKTQQNTTTYHMSHPWHTSYTELKSIRSIYPSFDITQLGYHCPAIQLSAPPAWR